MSVKSSSFDDLSCDTTINETETDIRKDALENEALDPRIQV
jgi:hypothetical protein